jgi:hypothetical protein
MKYIRDTMGTAVLDIEGKYLPEYDKIVSELILELKGATPEHGDIACVNNDTADCISIHRDNRIITENLDGNDGPRHIHPVTFEFALDVWKRFINDDIAYISSLPWVPGYYVK